jgi:selenocysteine lyase/cysteine desulfurase
MLRHSVDLAALLPGRLRRTEFSRLDRSGVAYLDYGGAALYGESQLRTHAALLSRGVFGNPHSTHGSSRASTDAIDTARRRVLTFFDAGDDYHVVFTANATAAIKLVAEAYPFARGTALILSADNHNSVNGIREYARRAGADVRRLPLSGDLRLDHPEERLASCGSGLLAFPAQSNFSGVQHPLALVTRAHDAGCQVLLDAAAFVPSHRLSLRACPADFVAVSFYKMFGYPTGVGALIARRHALAGLARPSFAGGTVEWVSVRLERHRFRTGHDGFEDGTANFLDIVGLDAGFAFLDRIGMETISRHVRALTADLMDQLTTLRHGTGVPAVRLYGPLGTRERGGTIAFNVLDSCGNVIPHETVEARADAEGVQVRGGCFCNPGAAEAAFGLDGEQLARIGAGALRASVGIATSSGDVSRLADVVRSFL